MTRRVVFVESNTTGTGELFARRALALDLAVSVVAADHARYRFGDIAGVQTITADTADTAGLTSLVGALGTRTAPVAAVMSTSDHFVGVAAAVATRLLLDGPRPDAIERCRDKRLQHRCLAAAGVPTPQSQSATSVRDALAAAEELGYPVICKPNVGSGSVGVRLCAHREELRGHAGRLLASATNERGAAIMPVVLLEEFIAGDEYSIEIVDGAVQAVIRKHLGATPHFVEIGHDYPATPGEGVAERLCAVAQDAVAALGLTCGPSHVEARTAPGGVRIIEVNPRLAGGRIPVLVHRCGGPDTIEATIRAALGEAPRSPVRAMLHGALRFVVVSQCSVAGRVAPSRLGEHGGWEAEMYVAAGARLQPHGDFRDRVGHVLACGPSGEQAQHIATQRAADLAATLVPAIDPAIDAPVTALEVGT